MVDNIMRKDVIIVGGGMVGLIQALALATHGLSSHIVDQAEPKTVLDPIFDGRVSSVASSSGKMLESIRLAALLAEKGCDIEQIMVCDQLKPGTLDFKPTDVDGALATMYPNQVLLSALHEAASENDHISLHMPARIEAIDRGEHIVTVLLADGTKISAPLIIGADGRNSMVRKQAGIQTAQWSYEHVAMICAITHEQPHQNVAYEIFYPKGPFAILPMLDDEQGAHRSAIVWSVDEQDAPAYMALSDRGFAAEMSKCMGGFLGDIELSAPRQAYPIGYHQTSKITADRIVLVGDAAHAIHPIAGQGLNLGIRDVAALTECVVEGARLGLDLADPEILARYERWRSLDNLMVAASSDGLKRLFGVKGQAASAIRRFGLNMVQRAPKLKAAFMAEARGESGDLPKMLQGFQV